MANDLPVEVRSLYVDSKVFALPKGDSDIRPLGKIDLGRKIATAASRSLNKVEICEPTP